MDAFQNLLSTPGGWHPILLEIALNEIGYEEATKLEDVFLDKEI